MLTYLIVTHPVSTAYLSANEKSVKLSTSDRLANYGMISNDHVEFSLHRCTSEMPTTGPRIIQ